MKVIVYYYATGVTKSIENVESVEARTNDNCLIINLDHGGCEVINMFDGKVDVKVVK